VLRHLLALLTVAALPAAAQTGFGPDFEGRALARLDGTDGAGPAALTLMLHGAGGNGPRFQRYSRFDRAAKRHGVLALYPSSADTWWNDGRFDLDTDDVGYLDRLIQTAIDRGAADPDRIFVLGHSNGGGMAVRLSCERPQRLAGIAVVATKALKSYTCPSSTPLPAIFIYGTRDPIAPHAGRPTGTEWSGGTNIGATRSALDTLGIWATRNRCPASPTERKIDKAGDRTTLSVLTWSNCAAPLAAIIVHGGGHGWPGARRALEWALGPATREVDAGDAALRFLLATGE